jgi:transcriptional regulator with XRE-family HTH domain
MQPTVDPSITSERLRALRVAAGLTQQQVAERAQVSSTFVSQLERGLVPKRSAVLPQILAVLNDEQPDLQRLVVSASSFGRS